MNPIWKWAMKTEVMPVTALTIVGVLNRKALNWLGPPNHVISLTWLFITDSWPW